jgi:hypothetical protein
LPETALEAFALLRHGPDLPAAQSGPETAIDSFSLFFCGGITGGAKLRGGFA